MTTRLSPLDASFLTVEEPTAHMHVGWHSVFAPPANRPRPTFEAMRDHIGSRLALAPRYRQRLEEVPLGAHHPVWVDDPHFDIRRHVHRAPSADLDEVVSDVMSEPLHRDRPLWEMWIRERTSDGRVGLVGKAHHCMVDGLAAVELTSMLLDPSPEPAPPPSPAAARPESAPTDPLSLLAAAVRDRVAEPIAALGSPGRLVPTRERIAGAAAAVERSARALTQAVGVPAPPSSLNEGTTPHRHLMRRTRPFSDLRDVGRRFGVTVNDVLLAAAAGALRGFLLDRGEEPGPLKAMVPVSRRDAADDLGNRISFVFAPLPCDEPDPRSRLELVAADMRERKRAGEPEGAGAALAASAFMPRFLQDALAHAMASPRVFNLVVSNVPGPPVPLYLLGCRLEEAHPVVPLAAGHAVSIGMLSVAGKACFGLYADRQALPDVERLAAHLDEEIDVLGALRPRRQAASRTSPRAAKYAPEPSARS